MDKKASRRPKPAHYPGSSENVKPSRIAYWERRDRQKKHENRIPPGELTEDSSDGSSVTGRTQDKEDSARVERRQFVDSYADLSPEARELALAIDAYKIHFHRRFISHEELLTVIRSLGYRQEFGP
ncbi:MAG: hypothetical protein IJF84_08675 [Thermoguttaceae bacterium]|nr:hypothetical protein [Thermoguttaceae bacterium]